MSSSKVRLLLLKFAGCRRFSMNLANELLDNFDNGYLYSSGLLFTELTTSAIFIACVQITTIISNNSVLNCQIMC